MKVPRTLFTLLAVFIALFVAALATACVSVLLVGSMYVLVFQFEGAWAVIALLLIVVYSFVFVAVFREMRDKFTA